MNSTGEIEYMNALAAFNLIESINVDTDYYLLLKLKSSYVKLDSIKEITDTCKLLHSKLASKSTPILREWIKLIQYIHPDVWNTIKDYEYFKGVSEEVGSRILGYYQDTPSLDLQYWNSAKSIRENLKNKIDSDTLSTINSTYSTLNTKMVESISDEFYDRERREIIYTYTQVQSRGTTTGLVAHDFHIAGDFMYKYVVDNIKNSAETAIKGILKDSIRLINYIEPINISVSISNNSFIIKPEQEEIIVNMKKDRIEAPIKTINNSVLTPEEVK